MNKNGAKRDLGYLGRTLPAGFPSPKIKIGELF